MTGSGTAADPYKIYNVNDLQAIEDDVTAYYELANDIDASATVGWNAGAGFAPISNFTGELDGKGHEITDLYIDRDGTDVGLFIVIGAAGVVKNLGLVDCDITQNGSAGRDAGGIAADHYGEINNCYTTGSVTSDSGAAGGICDDNEVGGLIVDSYSTCTVSGKFGAGGICQSNSGTIRRCYATGNVSANDAGGLAENNGSTGVIEECYATGDVTGKSGGGLVERNDGAITNCYARGNVVATSSGAGGLVEDNHGDIDKCYSTGTVTGPFKGGLVEATYGSGTVTNSFWDTETSGEETSDGGTGKTTTQMKIKDTFITAGWNFGSIWEIRTDRNDGYAHFQWQFPRFKGNPHIDQRIYQHVERMER